MTKTINLKDIIKIQHNLMSEFEALDSDYPERQIASQNRLAIKKRLNKITKDIKEQKQIEKTIYDGMWKNDDGSFKSICEKFEEIGWKVLYD